jgi:two-component system response regulator FixJ
MNRVVLLVDDNEGFRTSTAWLLGGMGHAVREFGSAEALLEAVDALVAEGCAACVLTDVRMPGLDGLQLHDALIARDTGWPVVYMTGHGDVPLAVAAMRKGACSFLEKPFRDTALEQALEEAFERAVASASARATTGPLKAPGAAPGAAPDRAAAAARTAPPESAGSASALARLTPRERQVLDLVVEGTLNKTIADRLGISIKTVELHRANMMQKMGARSIADLMRRVLSVEQGSR